MFNTSLMNPSGSLPDTSTPVSISLNNNNTEAKAWEAPIDCFASIRGNGQITGDMQQYFYIKGKNADTFHQYQRGTDGVYGGYCGHTMFFNKGDKMYQTGTVSGNLTLIYYPL